MKGRFAGHVGGSYAKSHMAAHMGFKTCGDTGLQGTRAQFVLRSVRQMKWLAPASYCLSQRADNQMPWLCEHPCCGQHDISSTSLWGSLLHPSTCTASSSERGVQREVDSLTWSETDWLGGGSQMCVAPACCSCPILLLTVSYHAPSLQLSQLKPAGGRQRNYDVLLQD